MLDQLGRVEVGDHDRRLKGLVDFLHGRDGAIGRDTDDNAIGLHQVLDGGTFAQELGITDDIDVSTGIVAADGLRHFFAGLYRDRAFIDDDAVFLDVDGDFPGDSLDEAEVDAAIGLRWCRYGDENDLGFLDGIADGIGEERRPAATFFLTISSRPGS